MPCFDISLNLPGFTIKKTTGYNPIIHDVVYHGKKICPVCGGNDLRKKDRFIREVGHETVGFRRVVLRFEVHKYYCRNCHRYFRERFSGILPWQRSTEPLQKQVYRLHTQGVSRKDLSLGLECSDSTISRWYDHVYELENKKRLSMRCPEVLGIDEHSFSKRHRYATTLCDLKKRRIFDIAQGRSGSDLSHYLMNLQGKERVKVVCMDLSETYRSICGKYFPNAKIVADRFHVVRVALHHLISTCQTVDPSLKTKLGLTILLRKHKKNLTQLQAQRLKEYLQKEPQINAIYQFKEKMMVLLLHKNKTKKQCRKLIPQFLDAIEKLKAVGFRQCRTLAKTLEKWQEEIVRMWRFSRTNGITEGFHRKMKLIQRRAFGFRNFENYRKRVRVLCI